jgi:UDP-N-acetylmuramyl-tripeptide synthetase
MTASSTPVQLHCLNATAAADWLTARVPTSGQLRTDSRQVRPGDAFIAWPGHVRDGRSFVAAVLAAGASACLVEAEGADAFDYGDAALRERIIAVPGLKAAAGPIADAFCGRPSDRLDVIATTGTNGKTSTAWWIAQTLAALGRRCGVIGTLGIGEPRADAVIPTGLTTPDPVIYQTALQTFADQGCVAAAIEASSIGLKENRLDGSRVRVALFTNFTPDHLDYHGTMAEYWAAKRMLFGWPGLRATVLNIDDAQGAALADELRREGSSDLAVWSCSLQRPARLRALDLHYQAGGLALTVQEGDQSAPVRSSLIGDYNAANLLGVIGVLRALGIPLIDAAREAGRVTPVPGRMQRVAPPSQGTTNLPQAVVDYAHTPDALEKALEALRPFAQARSGRLWCVFGCGGNRDATKRPVMGGIAARLADRVLLTSDNPRFESAEVILDQIAAGCADAIHVSRLSDRHAAIREALLRADPEDVVLIAGKGHEDYQEIAGQRQPFSDALEAGRALADRARG